MIKLFLPHLLLTSWYHQNNLYFYFLVWSCFRKTICDFPYFFNSIFFFQLFLALSCHDLLYCLLSWKLNILYTHYFTVINRQQCEWFRIHVMQPQASVDLYELVVNGLVWIPDLSLVARSCMWGILLISSLDLKRNQDYFSHFIDGELRNWKTECIMGHTQGQLHLCLLGWK